MRCCRFARRLHPDLHGLAASMLKVERQVKAVAVFERCLQVDQGQLVVTRVTQLGHAFGGEINGRYRRASQAIAIHLEAVQRDLVGHRCAGTEQFVSLPALVLDTPQICFTQRLPGLAGHSIGVIQQQATGLRAMREST